MKNNTIITVLLFSCVFNLYAQTSEFIKLGREEAEVVIKRYADRGNAYAQYLITTPSYNSYLKLSEEERDYYLFLSAENGYDQAQCSVGNRFETRGNYQKALEWYKKAANQGCRNALFNVGSFYFHGKGVPSNIEEAIKWYRKAAFLGDEMAEDTLRYIYRDVLHSLFYIDSAWELNRVGRGCIYKTPERAAFYFLRAAELGYPPAQYEIARMYEIGNGVKKNKKKAIKWYKESVKNGYMRSYCRLSYLLFEKDNVESRIYSLLAAKDGWSIGVDQMAAYEIKYDTSLFWTAICAKGLNEHSDIAAEFLGKKRSLSILPEVQWDQITQDVNSKYITVTAKIKSFTNIDSCILTINGKKQKYSIKRLDYPETHIKELKCRFLLESDNAKLYLLVNNKAGVFTSTYNINRIGESIIKLNSDVNNENAIKKPYIKILTPSNGSQYSNGIANVNILTPQDVPLFVEINGSEPIEIIPSYNKSAKKHDGELYVIKNLPKKPGAIANLTFFCKDSNGVESERKKLTLQCVGEVIKPKLILFAVGVGDYTSKDITKLKFAAKDARDFVNTINKANLDDYDTLIQLVYIDKHATRANIFMGLRNLLEKEARQGDVVMFYFSGHGVQDHGETYFMTIDASPSEPGLDGINFSDLRKNMRKLTERQVKVVAFMDACHSGAMTGTKGIAPKLTELNVENVIEFYSSTGGEESAEDPRLQNGIFTAGLISGLNGAAANATGYVTVNTLRTYIVDYVRKYNSRQTPVVKGVDAGDITIFKVK